MEEAEQAVERLMLASYVDDGLVRAGTVGSLSHCDDGCALDSDRVHMAVEQLTALDRLIKNEPELTSAVPVSLDGLVEEVKG